MDSGKSLVALLLQQRSERGRDLGGRRTARFSLELSEAGGGKQAKRNQQSVDTHV